MNANAIAWVGALRELRKARGLTQEQLARRADCSLGYVRLLEHGFVPSGESAVIPRVARVLAPNDDETPGKGLVAKDGEASPYATTP